MCLGFSHSQSVCGGRVNPLPCLDTNSDGPTDQQQKQKQEHNNVYFPSSRVSVYENMSPALDGSID